MFHFDSLGSLNEKGTIIRATRRDGSIKIIEPADTDLYAMAISGHLGEVADFVPPPQPTYEDRVKAWEQEASCDVFRLKLALAEDDVFDAAEAATSDMDAVWRIVWSSGGGTRIGRLNGSLSAVVGQATGADPGAWLDEKDIWSPKRPID